MLLCCSIWIYADLRPLFLDRSLIWICSFELEHVDLFLCHIFTQRRVSIARVVPHFPRQSLPAVTALDLETPCVCACQSDPPKLCWSAVLRAQPLILQSKPLIFFFGSDCQMTSKGFNLDSNLNSATWPKGSSCKGLICSKTQNNLCGIWKLEWVDSKQCWLPHIQPAAHSWDRQWAELDIRVKYHDATVVTSKAGDGCCPFEFKSGIS